MKQVRFLIVLYWAIVAIGFLLEFVVPSASPESVRLAYEALPGPDIDVPWVLTALVCLAGLVASVVSSFGLYVGRAWAPRLAIYATASFPFVYALFPVAVLGMLDMIVSDSSFIVWGALLASAYTAQYRADAANHSLQARRP